MSSTLSVAPGSVVLVRDEEWLVTSVEQTDDGQLLQVQGLSDLVRGTTASFFESLDTITTLDPREAMPVADDSPKYRKARLWLEATLRKTPIPLTEPTLAASQFALANTLEYQYAAVQAALDPANLHPRILLADAVGLGKTIEIGMILSELIRRGRGERILIVCPRHVLEQMQNEMWSRFAIPFVRLDSVGVQRVKQKLPANRNPFGWFKRVIISMDTLKQDRFAHDLHRHHWDAVVIDESHNVTGSTTQNNRLARTLAPNTDALILASATPHNGRKESFAELVRLLEPTAVSPQGELNQDDLKRLVKRRHRNSPEVASVAGADWAERKPPQNFLVPASPAENAVAEELERTWLHPASGSSPYSGAASGLFPWTIAKAFLSSPAALRQTLHERRNRLAHNPTPEQQREIEALDRLDELNDAAFDHSAKHQKLVGYLRGINIAKNSPERAVVFAERVATLGWLQEHLQRDLKLSADQVAVLHGGLDDVKQQQIVESFKQRNSPIRVLVTGDVASEGVNLHQQCHELIHFDIPWSLIRIEQRNGRIDRYGQKMPPQITTLLLDPDSENFRGDLRVLSRLLQREDEAHKALGDAASLMGRYDAGAEEDEIKRVLAGQRNFDDVVQTVGSLSPDDSLAALLASLDAPVEDAPQARLAEVSPLYPQPVDFLREALAEYYERPQDAPGARGYDGGVSWRDHGDGVVEFEPPADLKQRLEVLPQGYLHDRHVLERFTLATNEVVAQTQLARALTDDSDSSWPEAHYLSPLHPVLDWAADRALSKLARNQVFVVRGQVDAPTVLTVGTLTDKRGLVVAASWMGVTFPMPGNVTFAMVQPYASSAEMLAATGIGVDMVNPGAPTDVESLKSLIAPAVDQAGSQLTELVRAATQQTQERIAAWNQKTVEWQDEAEALIARKDLRTRRVSVDEEKKVIEAMRPERQLVRPLLVVVPADHPVASAQEATDAQQ